VSETLDFEEPLQGYYVTDVQRVVFMPVISSLDPGKGLVGAQIDKFKEDYDVVVVPTVMSEKLEGMLLRRDFHPETQWSRAMQEHVHCFVWRRMD